MAAYARWCETRHRYPTIVARIKAIARAHLLKCASVPDRHPTVVGTMKLIEAREQARPTRAALFAPEAEPAPTKAAGAHGAGKPAAPAPATVGKSKTPRNAMTMRHAPALVAKRPAR